MDKISGLFYYLTCPVGEFHLKVVFDLHKMFVVDYPALHR